MRLHRLLTLIAAGWVIIIIILVWVLPFDEDFRAGNPYWNGLRDLNASAENLESLVDIPATPGDTLLLIPYLPLSAAELEQVRTFVSRGGHLILADDYGEGNQVLAFLGLRARFSGQALLDPLVNYKTQQLPKITRLRSDATTGEARALVFNHATGLLNISGGEALASSSSFSFIDRNGNGKFDAGEPEGPVPVISRHTLAGGTVLLIADPSIFINGMHDLESNAAFIKGLVAPPGRLYIDQSHLPETNLHRSKIVLAEVREALMTPAGTLTLTLAAVWLILYPVWYKRGILSRIRKGVRVNGPVNPV